MMSDNFILLVEDNPDEAALTEIAFKEIRSPHRLVHVPDGAAALNFLFATGEYAGRKKGDTPALILLDLKLPKVSGIDVLKKLRADPLLKHLVVVVLTSSKEEKDRLEVEMIGANLFIQKPINYDDFIQIAREVDTWLMGLSGPGYGSGSPHL